MSESLFQKFPKQVIKKLFLQKIYGHFKISGGATKIYEGARRKGGKEVVKNSCESLLKSPNLT